MTSRAVANFLALGGANSSREVATAARALAHWFCVHSRTPFVWCSQTEPDRERKLVDCWKSPMARGWRDNGSLLETAPPTPCLSLHYAFQFFCNQLMGITGHCTVFHTSSFKDARTLKSSVCRSWCAFHELMNAAFVVAEGCLRCVQGEQIRIHSCLQLGAKVQT
eukprot:5060132-Amphidinium_carterae.1